MRKSILSLLRKILGIALIIIGVISGFIPIIQGWIFILAGLLLLGVKRQTIKKQARKFKRWFSKLKS